ncbi:MAG: bifunctional 5,10-methylenetetrahydrofolate dehydrogenase/5,10-methenyltetrahydrofolate cyclohydrolase, partial [Chitinophagaceae bacterium]
MKLLDGKIVAERIKRRLTGEVSSLKEFGKSVPHLVAILVGNDGASETYVEAKVKTCNEIGFQSTFVRLGINVEEAELFARIEKFNNDPNVHGILVQLPLPKHISEHKVISLIDPAKDVDGFNPVNIGKVVQGTGGFVPATPRGILLMLEHYM